jgi:SAM-dependent methyltransferase
VHGRAIYVAGANLGAVSEFASTYDALASRWDTWAARVVPPLREAWVARIDAHVEAGAEVVELGCGTGRPVGERLAARHRYTGVDASAGMLAEARRTLPHATFVHADMETVTFPPASLGAVVAFFSIVHVPRDRHRALFAAIASWLRPGGVFVGTLHSHDEPDDYSPDWLEAGPMRWSGFDRATNLALLADAGFDVVDAEVVEQTEPDGCVIRPLVFLAKVAP